MTVELSAEEESMLRHTVGASPGTKKKSRGYRNNFCVDVGSGDDVLMQQLVRRGLMVAGATINNGTSRYYHATQAGCDAIGLHKAATSRALEKIRSIINGTAGKR